MLHHLRPSTTAPCSQSQAPFLYAPSYKQTQAMCTQADQQNQPCRPLGGMAHAEANASMPQHQAMSTRTSNHRPVASQACPQTISSACRVESATRWHSNWQTWPQHAELPRCSMQPDRRQIPMQLRPSHQMQQACKGAAWHLFCPRTTKGWMLTIVWMLLQQACRPASESCDPTTPLKCISCA